MDKLRHTRSVAYSVELVLLNKHQISGSRAYPHCYQRFAILVTLQDTTVATFSSDSTAPTQSWDWSRGVANVADRRHGFVTRRTVKFQFSGRIKNQYLFGFRHV